MPVGIWAFLDARIPEETLERLWKCLLEDIDVTEIREHIRLFMNTKKSFNNAHEEASKGNSKESLQHFDDCLSVSFQR